MRSVRARLGSRVKAWLKPLRRLIGGEPQDQEQLVELLKDAKSRALFDAEALSMMEGALQVADLRVRDIMIPRADVVCVRRDDPLEEILRVAVESAHSRFPVVGDDKGEVVGMLLAKDMLPLCVSGKERRVFNIRDLLRSAVFVPESKHLDVLLREFRASRNHMAIVVDEYGNAAGVVTIEDVLEQIVGEIEDEHDFDEGPPIFKRNAREYTAKARTTIEEFNDFQRLLRQRLFRRDVRYHGRAGRECVRPVAEAGRTHPSFPLSLHRNAGGQPPDSPARRSAAEE